MAGNPPGNRITNEIMYMANLLNRGQMPYGGAFQSAVQGLRDYKNRVRGVVPAQQTQDYYRQRGLSSLDDKYKEQELAAGAAAERFRPGAGFPGQQGMFTPSLPGPGTTPPAVLDPYAAQNRAYQQERARVEAMVKANPDMQKQEIADARAKVRDQGMAAWAAANPELAKKLQPGQVGYDAIQGTLAGNMARAGQGFGMAEQLVPTPQGFPTQVPGLPTGAGYSTGFGMTTNLAPGVQTPPPYSTIRPSSELSGLGAAPLGTAQTSTFGQPNVMDPEQFEKLLKMVQK